MKLCLGPLAVVVGTVLLTGCGPGLGHHGKFAQGASDAVSTTSLTGADLPNERMPVGKNSGLKPLDWEDPWADERSDGDSDAKLQTWGAGPKPEDKYGF